jgi:uncharacterized membrane protein YhhN
MTSVFVAATLVAVGWLLVADRRASRAGIWTWKPIASTGFVATALAAGALGSVYGRLVLAALVFCWLGDVLLIPDDDRSFRFGILAFLVGHVLFVAAFLGRGVEARATLLALAAQSPTAWLTLRWLRPHLRPGLRTVVPAYVVVISVMVATACGTFVAAPCGPLLAGALGFALSDTSVARDRFVLSELVNRAWGLPLYYVAELLLATSVRG